MSSKWAVFRCIDGRLNEPLGIFLRSLDVPDEHFLFTLVGGMKNHLELITKLDIATNRLGVTNVVFFQHTDCKAYNGREMCGGTEELDREFQLNELRRAEEIICKTWNGLYKRFFLIHISDQGTVSFEEI